MFVDYAEDVESCSITEYDPMPEVVILKQSLHVHAEKVTIVYTLNLCLYWDLKTLHLKPVKFAM